MLKFVAESHLARPVAEKLSGAERVNLAVSFWGDGACEKLGLDKTVAHVRIICDPWSGACNPKELKTLLGKSNIELLALRGLHSKVYWTPHWMLVSSANASANGLGDEARELAGTVEAGICTDDEGALAECRTMVLGALERK
jgi:hypothetical protein